MKWIAIHQNEVVGEFMNEADAECYKEAADKTAFDVVLVCVDDKDFGCYIKITGIYGMPNRDAYYRKSGDCFDFCSDMKHATFFPGGRDNKDVKKILDAADWYTKLYNADKLIAQPFYQVTEQTSEPEAELLNVGFFLSIVQGILKPNPGTEFYHASAERRLEGFKTFWTQCSPQLKKEHSKVWKIISDVLKHYDCMFCTIEVLEQLNDDIQKHCVFFEDETA